MNHNGYTRTILFTAVVAALAATMVGCGGGGGGGEGGFKPVVTPMGDDRIVGGHTITFDDSNSIIPAMANGAKKRGCVVESTDRTMKARCSEGVFAAYQEANKFTYGCNSAITDDGCRKLMVDIARTAKGD